MRMMIFGEPPPFGTIMAAERFKGVLTKEIILKPPLEHQLSLTSMMRRDFRSAMSKDGTPRTECLIGL
jgi:hypothetical protein